MENSQINLISDLILERIRQILKQRKRQKKIIFIN